MGCLSCAGFVKGMGGATRLALKESLSATVEADCLTPESLAGRSGGEIAALPVGMGSEKVTLGDLFDIEPGLTEDVILEGDLAKVNGIGKSMAHGRLTVQGNAGAHLGASMRGGEILVQGDAGEYAGAQMTGGLIRIRGDAGDRAGALYPGRTEGVDGGAILIEGRAGHELGAGMRRGLIAVRGDAGDFAGARMIGGTIFIFGRPGDQAGTGNRRGTIVVLGDYAGPPPSYVLSCTYSPTFLDCFYKQFRQWEWDLPGGVESGLYRRFIGDQNVNGKGEILVFSKS
ncbi:MAG: formylmethanofuran dehydrogenase subunit C [Pseudodesulfovibrio sp.]|uniref:formylmethanofuran dehydrogenase subunit C n=1 Tax=Pseudodesulfovibrio sp. TaxID=2035812 RepID=UPI003D10154C